MEGGAVGPNFERDLPKEHPCQDWFNLVQRFQRRRFKCEKSTNQKQELPVAAMFVNGSQLNEQLL
jgi:hypothetical protein